MILVVGCQVAGYLCAALGSQVVPDDVPHYTDACLHRQSCPPHASGVQGAVEHCPVHAVSSKQFAAACPCSGSRQTSVTPYTRHGQANHRYLVLQKPEQPAKKSKPRPASASTEDGSKPAKKKAKAAPAGKDGAKAKPKRAKKDKVSLMATCGQHACLLVSVCMVPQGCSGAASCAWQSAVRPQSAHAPHVMSVEHSSLCTHIDAHTRSPSANTFICPLLHLATALAEMHTCILTDCSA